MILIAQTVVLPAIIATATVWCASVGVVDRASADEPLRWKFAVGDVRRFELMESLQTSCELSAKETVASSFQQTIELLWKVEQVAPDGAATISQTIPRLRVHAEIAGTPPVIYDSAAEKEAAGFAAMLAPLGKALRDSPCRLTVTPRGVVKNVEAPAALTDAIKNSPGAAELGDLATAEGFKLLMAQAWPTLAEAPGGKGAMAATEIKIPALGAVVVERSYRADGTTTVSGKSLARLVPALALKIVPDATAKAKVEVTEQSSTGEVLFDAAAGTLVKSTFALQMQLQATVRDQSYVQRIDRASELRRLPEQAVAR